MSIFLTLAYLFFVGSVIGWILELLYRNISQRNKKWVNPGFCTGPYLPIYGFGLCVLYLLIKSDCAALRKLLSKAKPEKMTESDLLEIRQAMQRLESSSANACALAEQE